MTKIKALALSATFFLVPAVAQADTVLGLYIGAQGWNANYDGRYGLGADVEPFYIDNDDTNASFYAALEHPVPLIPNVKIRTNDLEVDRAADFSNTDYTLYYEIFDNDIISIDVGLNGKKFDGTVRLLANDVVSEFDFSGVVPTAYAAARLGLPFTNWSVTGEAKAVSFDDSNLHDVQAALEYRVIDNLAVDVSVSAGYRSMKVELDDVDGIYSDVNFDGPFVAVDVHF